MPSIKKPRYYLVAADMLPEIFVKVTRAKELLETGEAATVAEAVESVGISRSAFYKYRDAVSPFWDMKSGRILTFSMTLRDRPGVLSALLSVFADAGANILTINQSIPVSGCAAVTVSAEISDMRGTPEELLEKIGALDGIIMVEILAG